MRFARLAALLAACTLLPLPARADSPLTSTEFHPAYAAELDGVPPGAEIEFLLGDHPTDVKAAVINRLGWKFEGQGNARNFFEALARKHEVEPASLDFGHLAAQDLFVLGYLLAMDDYFKLKALVPKAHGLRGAPAIDLLNRAAAAAPDDFTIALVLALVQGQRDMSKSFCAVWQHLDRALRAFPPERRNFKPAALDVVVGYIGAYRDDCQPPSPKANPEFNQIYALAVFRNWIAAGTQAGLALWDRDSLRLHSVESDFICSSLQVERDRLFTGSYHRLRSFDGKRWKTYLDWPKSHDAFKLLRTPKGELLAIHNRKVWGYNPRRDRFTPLPGLAWPFTPYALGYDAEGRMWAIDFLQALVVDERRIPRQSEIYPGRDPRSFVLDAFNRFWVVDFESGFFRWDPKAGRFLADPTIPRQASDLAVDPRTETLYLLHYRDGLYALTGGREPVFTDLRALEYMRAMLLDDRGVIWVGGWNQLLRLAGQPGDWKIDRLAVGGS